MRAVRLSFADSKFLDLAEQEDYAFPHPIQRLVLPLISVDGSTARPLGSGFLIGPGFLVTARHVVDQVLSRALTGEVTMFALYLSDQAVPEQTEEFWGLPLNVRHVSVASDPHAHDLALLTIDFPTLPDGTTPRPNALPISFVPPDLGSKLLVLGYSDMQGGEIRDGESGPVIPHSQRVRASQGQLAQVHMPYRDRAMLTFPVLEADYFAPHGMSGGPVFSESGQVVGVVCSGADVTDDQEPLSYASLLPHLLGLSAAVLSDAGEVVFELLWDLLDEGVLQGDGTHRLYPRANFVSPSS